MDLRRVGDSLLRSRSSPLFSFLAPSVFPPSLRIPAVQRPLCVALTKSSRRQQAFSTCPIQLQASSPTPAAAETEPDEPESSPQPSEKEEPRLQDMINNLLNDSLGGINYKGKGNYEDQRKPPQQQNKLSSAALLERDYRKQKLPRGELLANRQGVLSRDMVIPEYDSPRSLQQYDGSYGLSPLTGKEREITPRNRLTMRLNPSVGRTVDINPARGMDLARGLKALAINCAINNVRQDAARQRFHERAGLKRKRLKADRWRKKFKLGFKGMIAKVKDMRKKGW